MSEKKESNSQVLSVRVPQELLDGLEVLRCKWIKQNRGISCSREDMVRAILWKAIAVGEGVLDDQS